jgi:sec-independent protein translocase protein TatA
MGFLKEPSHLLIMLLVVVVLFGSRRLPDVARGLGQSMRIFKSEVKQMKDDDQDGTKGGKGGAGQASSTEPEPLEGRVLRDNQTRAGEVRRDV